MPHVPEEFGPRAIARALKGLNPNDIDQEELDNVIMRIFVELRRQLSQMEAIKENIEAVERERNARILGHLERTMERLVKLEAERSAARKTKAVTIDGHAVEVLETRIDRIIAAAHKKARAEEDSKRKAGATSGDGVEL
ncbi:MAG TPA: hypothetical protein VGM17_15195 [Rhizomicrobium sp.]|jgi:hypothetical protein